MSDFVPGFASRHEATSQLLHQAFAMPATGFEAAASWERKAAPEFAAQGPGPAGPRHFSPADPEGNPTEGWDPFDAEAPAAAFIDPLAAAHAAGYAEGLAAALAEQRGADARDRALIEELVAALATPRFDRAAIAEQLRQTVLLLVRQLIGEAGVAPEVLAHRVHAAADLLADRAESALLRVNPADLPLLEGMLPASVFAAGDASVARGSFVLESASTVVEDGPAIWLEQLAQAIERVGVPTAC